MEPLLFVLLLSAHVAATQFFIDPHVFSNPVFAPLWHDRYNTQVVAPHDGWSLPGNFTHPPAANCNSTDFHRNERIKLNSTYPLQWAWTNSTKSISWDVYLVNEYYEKRLIFRPSGSQQNMSGYLWEAKDAPNDPFLASAAMVFFYVVKREGSWAEGFASRFVNISRTEVEALKTTSAARVHRVRFSIAVPLVVIMALLVLL